METPINSIVPVDLNKEMQKSFIAYAMAVIINRALPDVRDGLKPVHRRILYSMSELNMYPDKPYRKSARLVGDVLGKYHPHGDSAVYDAMVCLAQDFSIRYPLVDGHGNFGSVDGDGAAAMRYTESRMSKLTLELLRDIDKDTVDFYPNFDETLEQPAVLPARFPNLLVNGTGGIAVGMATNIPPHNMGEAIDATIALMDNPDISIEELIDIIPGPDFPTGGIIMGVSGIREAYKTGRGRIRVRAKTEIEKHGEDRERIIVTEIPYQVNKATLVEKIAELVRDKRIDGISDLRDESDKSGMRIVIELKRNANANVVLNHLYKHTQMQDTFGVIMLALVDGEPRVLNLKQVLEYYVEHQKDVIVRRTKFELEKAKKRAHILEGLIIALDNIDEIVNLIRSSADAASARAALIGRFGLTEIQAQAILDMRLQRLTNLEILTLRKEYAEIEKRIAYLKGILASEKKLMNVIKKELEEIGEKYADARRTKLVDSFGEIVIEEEAPVADEVTVVVTRAGFVRRFARRAAEKALEGAEPSRAQLDVMTDEKLLFFTDAGNCYAVGVSQIPECRPRDRGLPLGGLLAGLAADERFIFVYAPGKDWAGEMTLLTEGGLIKRMAVADLNVRKARYAALTLREGDKLAAVLPPTACKDVLVVTRQGMAICFSLADVSVLGRTAAGVKAIQLAPADRAVACIAHDGEGEALLVTDRGYMKRCLLLDFDRQARGGKGLKAITFLKNGMNGEAIVAALPVREARAFTVFQKSGAQAAFNTEEIAIETRAGKGQPYVLAVMGDCVEDVLMG